MKKHRRRGERRQLKAWSDPAWQRKLSKTLTVSRVDENIPGTALKRKRKPWFVALTQNPERLTEVGSIGGLPAGTTMLLSEQDVLALVHYLLEPQTAMWLDNPERTEPGRVQGYAFLQHGMLAFSASGQPVNGEADWTPTYFRRQRPIDISEGLRTRKVHTLPWTLES
jgi:hypothetical protein